jgi:mono/diheme cytochrome c family protein
MSVLKRKWVAVFLASVGLMVGIYYFYTIGPSATGLLQVQNTTVVASGKSIYRSNCASCHGDQLEGQPNWKSSNADLTMPAPPHNERGHTWHHDDQILFHLTKYGVGKFVKQKGFKSNMPAYEDLLTDQQIIAVLSFIKSTWPEHVQERHDQLNAQNNGKKK